jgi:uncharacterized protein YuzE
VKITYDADVDALHIQLGRSKVQESDEIESGIVLDYNQRGKVVGIEILGASKRDRRIKQKKGPEFRISPYLE